MRSGGSITFEITGGRKYSRDLPQGSMEIPFILKFAGELVKIEKVKQLFKEAPVGKAEEVKDSNISDGVNSTITSYSDSGGGPSGGPPMKKQKIICLSEEIVDGEAVENDTDWVHIGKILLKAKDKEILVDGLELNDLHVNASQTLLKTVSNCQWIHLYTERSFSLRMDAKLHSNTSLCNKTSLGNFNYIWV